MKSFDISLQFEKNPSNKCFQAIWKNSSSRSRKSESEVKNYPLLKKSCTLENELKIALLLLCFFDHVIKAIDQKLLSNERHKVSTVWGAHFFKIFLIQKGLNFFLSAYSIKT